MPLQAAHTTHPRTYGYQTTRPERWANGWLPDAVTDTTGKRRRGAQRLLGNGCGVFSRLWMLPGHQLWHLVVPLPALTDFYGDAQRLGKAEIQQLYPHQPALIRAARGRSGQAHLHVAVALPAGQQPLRSGTYGPIYAATVGSTEYLWSLALYFSRPADERAARPNKYEVLRYSPEQLRLQRLDAAEAYLQARLRHGRLPRLRWQQHLPRSETPGLLWLGLCWRRIRPALTPWPPPGSEQPSASPDQVRPYRHRPGQVRNRGPPNQAHWESPTVLSPALPCSPNGFSPPTHFRPRWGHPRSVLIQYLPC